MTLRLSKSPVQMAKRMSCLAWLALAMIIAGYLAAIVQRDLRGHFAEYYDDALHVMTAQALARGEGYILPNVPEKPAPKYPVLYPWILSWIWWWDADLAPDTGWAFAVNAFFGCLYLGVTFVMLRSWRSVGAGWALAACAFCAFDFNFLDLSSRLLSDVPFMALAACALLLADHEPGSRLSFSRAVAAGLAVGVCILIRTTGLGVAGGSGCSSRFAATPAHPWLSVWGHCHFFWEVSRGPFTPCSQAAKLLRSTAAAGSRSCCITRTMRAFGG